MTRVPPIAEIKRLIAARYGVSVEDLVSRKRREPLSRARRALIFLARAKGLPMSVIGRCVGKRDRTSIRYALKVAREALRADPAFAAEIEALRADIEGGRPSDDG